MHFQRVNFVLVCPPVEKIIVAQRSVQHLLRRPYRAITSFSKFQPRALAGSQHRNHPKNVITRCDNYRNCESMAPNTWSAGKKDYTPFL